jgi:hypothetical protein
LTSRIEAEGITGWTFDTATDGVGLLASVAAPDSYSETHTYDTLSRPARVTRNLTDANATAEAFDFDFAYHGDTGRLDTLTYPSGLLVRQGYGTTGYLVSVTQVGGAATVYWAADSRNAAGQVTGATFGNGIVRALGYEPQTGRVATINDQDTGVARVALAMSYDLVGNLTARGETVLDRQEDFTYDRLNRLTGTELSDTVAQLTLASLTYSYDALGNIVTKSDVTGTYTYGSGNAGGVTTDAGPHAVTAAGGSTYAYDDNGSVLTGGGRTVTWTTFNKPAAIASREARR